jgi:HD superfamily phosphohydrolase
MKSYIHDPIHGHIFLTDLERWTVDTLEFQRLRFIRQNSLLHYVFPGAFHTRFAHSLGACHVSDRISKQLINWVNEPEIYYPIQVYRLACLLHDVGHGAFSHMLSYVKIQGESFMPSLSEVISNHKQWGLEKNSFIYKFMKNIENSEGKHPVEHEVLSLIIINQIFSSLPAEFIDCFTKEELIQDVCSLIEIRVSPSDTFLEKSIELYGEAQKFIPHIQHEKSFQGDVVSPRTFHKVLSSVVSGTLDADRMDYLLRDSQAFGVNYGLFDLEGILSSLSLVVEDGEFYLGLNAKRINTFDDFIWSRYQMFKQIYCHKTHVAYNLLLNESMEELVLKDKLTPPNDIKEFLYLTDDFIMGMVFHEAQKNPEKQGKIQDFSKRKLPKYLGVYEASTDDPIWNKNYKEIYYQTDFEKYENWQEDQTFQNITMKAEVIKGQESRIPLAYIYDKISKSFVKKDYLSQSVFFGDMPDSENREQALTHRLNKKLMYFFTQKK